MSPSPFGARFFGLDGPNFQRRFLEVLSRGAKERAVFPVRTKAASLILWSRSRNSSTSKDDSDFVAFAYGLARGRRCRVLG